MSTAAVKKYTIAEYFALERTSPVKHEYFAGELFAMAGGTESHNLICGNLVREFGNQLADRPCRVYTSDMRVKTAAGLYTYPDVGIVCEKPVLDDERSTLLNPLVICEVLSPTTEAYDRGKKFQYYRSLASLREYLLVSQDRVLVEHFARQSDTDQWILTAADSMDEVIHFPALGFQMELRQIYAKVDLQPGIGLSSRS